MLTVPQRGQGVDDAAGREPYNPAEPKGRAQAPGPLDPKVDAERRRRGAARDGPDLERAAGRRAGARIRDRPADVDG